MVDPKTPDIWTLLFDQTPPVFRWALGMLTLGIFTLASVLYRWHRDDLKEVHDRVDRLERRIEAHNTRLGERIDAHNTETNRLLFQIARNTGSGTGE